MPGHILYKSAGKRVPESAAWMCLVDHWRAVLNKYLSRIEEDDLPQWYNERSHTGFLAAAVWRMGGIALEEFSTSREHGNKSGVAELSSGQCDLYFSVENLNCLVEAKREWVTGYTKQDAQRIKKRLGEAEKQLRTIPKPERAEQGIRLCWAVPWVRPNLSKERQDLKEFAHQFSGPSSLVGVYYVDHPSRRKAESNYENEERSYPGIIMIATALSNYSRKAAQQEKRDGLLNRQD
ncbi:MAG: hypothetical protein ABL970_14245 [Nitrospira sp.]